MYLNFKLGIVELSKHNIDFTWEKEDITQIDFYTPSCKVKQKDKVKYTLRDILNSQLVSIKIVNDGVSLTSELFYPRHLFTIEGKNILEKKEIRTTKYSKIYYKDYAFQTKDLKGNDLILVKNRYAYYGVRKYIPKEIPVKLLSKGVKEWL